jgi:hypothetical protein
MARIPPKHNSPRRREAEAAARHNARTVHNIALCTRSQARVTTLPISGQLRSQKHSNPSGSRIHRVPAT